MSFIDDLDYFLKGPEHHISVTLEREALKSSLRYRFEQKIKKYSPVKNEYTEE